MFAGGAANRGVSLLPNPLCDTNADISLVPLASIQLARPGLIDGAARWTQSQLVILININVNNTQTACWRTNKHVNNASTRSDGDKQNSTAMVTSCSSVSYTLLLFLHLMLDLHQVVQGRTSLHICF